MSPVPPVGVPDAHLDLGCGTRPRNPYRRSRVCGVDIRAIAPSEGFQFRSANVSLEPIPYPDHEFGSVSAFDFIEHVPRILIGPDGHSTIFPFVRLMNEAWRVLAHGGRFYAVTPAYPNPEAFQDPTHVNIITERTHEYFCGEDPLGRMYGFTGHFEVRRAEWVRLDESFFAGKPSPGQSSVRSQLPWYCRVARIVRDASRSMRATRAGGDCQYRRGRLVYFLWEFEAVKPPMPKL